MISQIHQDGPEHSLSVENHCRQRGAQMVGYDNQWKNIHEVRAWPKHPPQPLSSTFGRAFTESLVGSARMIISKLQRDSPHRLLQSCTASTHIFSSTRIRVVATCVSFSSDNSNPWRYGYTFQVMILLAQTSLLLFRMCKLQDDAGDFAHVHPNTEHFQRRTWRFFCAVASAPRWGIFRGYLSTRSFDMRTPTQSH